MLLLDYDGTLAPFRVERGQAVPYPGVREALRRLTATGRTRLVIVSGRTVPDLRAVLGLEPPPELWGTHGWEHLRPGRPLRLRPLPSGAADALERARGMLDTADRLEAKPASLALHVRGLDPEEAERTVAEVRRLWEPLAHEAGLEVQRFDGGIELRVPGWDKGGAVRSVLEEEPPGTAVAYLGDDRTDEDAFAALDEMAEHGGIDALSVLVGDPPRDSRAAVRLETPGGLLDFLARWSHATAS